MSPAGAAELWACDIPIAVGTQYAWIRVNSIQAIAVHPFASVPTHFIQKVVPDPPSRLRNSEPGGAETTPIGDPRPTDDVHPVGSAELEKCNAPPAEGRRKRSPPPALCSTAPPLPIGAT